MIKLTFIFLFACLCQPSLAEDTIPDNICIDVNYMMPQKYPTRAVNDFCLCLKGDTVISRLPYMGEAYHATYGDTDGLNFKLPITNKSIKTDKKNKTIIKFTCKNAYATYDFKIEVYPEGGAYINLIPSYTESISYKGDWK